jgi:polyisoprenoid-binding protein YceI
MFTKTLIAASLALTLGTTAFAETYKIDTDGAHASINFEAIHLGFSVLTGRFDTFDGSFEFDNANPADGSVTVNIDIDSVNSNHAKRDNHLRSADFFDVSNHPTASFTSTGINVTGDKAAVITGDLTIRGITKSVDLDSTFIGEGDDPWGGYRAGFSGATTINLGDFGMDGPLGNAPVKLSIHVEGIRQ